MNSDHASPFSSPMKPQKLFNLLPQRLEIIPPSSAAESPQASPQLRRKLPFALELDSLVPPITKLDNIINSPYGIDDHRIRSNGKSNHSIQNGTSTMHQPTVQHDLDYLPSPLYQSMQQYNSSSLHSFEAPEDENLITDSPTAISCSPKNNSSVPENKKNNYSKSSTTTTPARSSRGNKIKVVIRIRPPIREDLQYYPQPEDFEISTRVHAGERDLTLGKEHFPDKLFSADHVLGMESSQNTMYDIVARDIVNDVLKGYNGTVFAYGQTGSGKTYSIFGKKATTQKGAFFSSIHDIKREEYGVIPRAVHQIFDHIQKNQHEADFTVVGSFIEIYNDNIYDLLVSTTGSLNIREDTRTGEVYVENITQVAVRSPMQLLELISLGSRTRVTASTLMNKDSSRSHVLLFISVEQSMKHPENGFIGKKVKKGLLTIVDLAGSERLHKTGSEGTRLEEVKHINKSLSALGNCISALSSNKNRSHIPFRDCKLTRILTESLSGKSKACLCATVSPASAHYEETLSTLLFAMRAKNVTIQPQVNQEVVLKEGELLQKLQTLETEKQQLILKNRQLEMEVSRLREQLIDKTIPTSITTWKQREQELTYQFGGLIQSLQQEINSLKSQTQTIPMMTTFRQSPIEKLIEGLLAIPNLKEKLWEQLEKELLDEVTTPIVQKPSTPPSDAMAELSMNNHIQDSSK